MHFPYAINDAYGNVVDGGNSSLKWKAIREMRSNGERGRTLVDIRAVVWEAVWEAVWGSCVERQCAVVCGEMLG